MAEKKKKPAAARAPLPQSGYVATRTLRVGHGFVHGGEIFPDTPTSSLLSLGWIVPATNGTQPRDPLAGVFDDETAAAIRDGMDAPPIPDGTPAPLPPAPSQEPAAAEDRA